MTGPEYMYFLNMIFSTASDEVRQRLATEDRYKPEPGYLDPGNLGQLSNLITDMIFRCPIGNITRGPLWGEDDTWVYLFNNSLDLAQADKEEWGDIDQQCEGQAPHGSDVPAVFNAFSVQSKTQKNFQWHVSEKEKHLFHAMLRYWVNFVKTGDPNEDGLALWQRSQSGSGLVNRFVFQTDDVGNGPSMDTESPQGCEVFDEAGYYW